MSKLDKETNDIYENSNNFKTQSSTSLTDSLPINNKTTNDIPRINSDIIETTEELKNKIRIKNNLAKNKKFSSLTRSVLVHEYDDDAPLAYLKVSLSKDNLSKPTIIHPIENKYSSKLLLRYPPTDYSENEKLTPYIGMFCFPNEISLKYSIKQPNSTYHSFVNTSSLGEKSYGVCVIIYEKIKGNVRKSYEEELQKWIKENIDESEKEYINHIQTELEKQQDELTRIKSMLKNILYKSDQNEVDEAKNYEELNKNMNEVSENVKLYKEILNSLGIKKYINIENVYQPKCIGVTSSWPWYNILKDWLSLVVREITGGFGNTVCMPIERYIKIEYKIDFKHI